MLEGSCHCGEVTWRYAGTPQAVTACNCTLCRRYGTLWAYHYENEWIHVAGDTRVYRRGRMVDFHFCARCGCVAYWRSQVLEPNGQRRMAVNVRLAEPESVAHLPVEHFDGLDTFEDLPLDGRCVRDVWF